MTSTLFSWPIASASDTLSDAALLGALSRFEVVLAQEQAALGLISASAATAIAAHAGTLRWDPPQLARDGADAGSLAIPFVAALRAHVAIHDPDAADCVHFGTTSQDLLDTALCLCLKAAVGDLDAALHGASNAAVKLAHTHRSTPMLARTLLQPAGVTTFGYKAAQWAHALVTVRERLAADAADALCVSLGGAVGNLSAYGDQGDALRTALARALGLRDPGASWHTQRESMVRLAATLGIAGGAMAKIATDLSLMMQAEVGEASESLGGGSTAIPHKRNPVLTLRVLAATQVLPGLVANLMAGMGQEHERALGAWQAEAQQYRVLAQHALAAAQALSQLLASVHIDAARCIHNIEALHGTIFSEALTALFARALGKQQAQDTVAALCAQVLAHPRPLRDLARTFVDATPALAAIAPSGVDAVFDLTMAARASTRAADALLARLA